MIECIRFKSHVTGHLQGFADLYIPKWGIEIPGFTVWMKDGRRWVNAPSTKYTDKEGNEKNKSFFYFRNKEHWAAFVEDAKDAIDKWCKENSEEQPTTEKFDNTECPF